MTGSSGLEGEIESDIVLVRHRDVPGDRTRSVTCKREKYVSNGEKLFVRYFSEIYLNAQYTTDTIPCKPHLFSLFNTN